MLTSKIKNRAMTSNARGMLAGFILGCFQGLETVPEQWLEDMTAHEKIIRLMQ